MKDCEYTAELKIQEVLPGFKVNVKRTEDWINNVISIEIRELHTAQWGFPELQVEALNKLEYLLQLPFVSEVEVTEIHWPNLESFVNPGISLDAYYKIHRTKSSGTCEEFLKTLQPQFLNIFRCRRVGEERSSRTARISVVKLELFCQTQESTQVNDSRQSLEYATVLQRRDGQCVYPVQLRRRKLFYEPVTGPNGGYPFVIYLNRLPKRNATKEEICSVIQKRTGIPMVSCERPAIEDPQRIFIETAPRNESVLNLMAQMMERLNIDRSETCTANVALTMDYKKIPEE
ncbi:unnamed protein product [Dicrocoelium dendriticum]|nr:unnamed protein product [Dicrocoelium dendriticum]